MRHVRLWLIAVGPGGSRAVACHLRMRCAMMLPYVRRTSAGTPLSACRRMCRRRVVGVLVACHPWCPPFLPWCGNPLVGNVGMTPLPWCGLPHHGCGCGCGCGNGCGDGSEGGEVLGRGDTRAWPWLRHRRAAAIFSKCLFLCDRSRGCGRRRKERKAPQYDQPDRHRSRAVLPCMACRPACVRRQPARRARQPSFL